MHIDLSTTNVLLTLAVGFQAWIVRELICLKIRVAVITDHCPYCGGRRPPTMGEAAAN